MQTTGAKLAPSLRMFQPTGTNPVSTGACMAPTQPSGRIGSSAATRRGTAAVRAHSCSRGSTRGAWPPAASSSLVVAAAGRSPSSRGVASGSRASTWRRLPAIGHGRCSQRTVSTPASNRPMRSIGVPPHPSMRCSSRPACAPCTHRTGGGTNRRWPNGPGPVGVFHTGRGRCRIHRLGVVRRQLLFEEQIQFLDQLPSAAGFHV